MSTPAMLGTAAVVPVLGAAVIVPVLATAGALAALVGGLGALARRFRWEPELARKSTHVAVGLSALALPALFASATPVLVLAGVACAGLFALRRVPALRARFGCGLHGIERASLGEFAFVAGVASTFATAHGDAAAYAAAILTLTFGDALAALVGRRFGRHSYAVGEARKSVEGSAAFFVVAAAAACAVAGGGTTLAAVVAFALVTTLAEAACAGGFDNAAIPLAGIAVLRLSTGAPL